MFSEPVQSRSDQKAATRSKVLATAEQHFRDNGFDATTIRGIAADAEVSVGTVMAVGDKETLLVTVFDEWIAAVHRQRRSAADNDGPITADDVPSAIVNLLLPFIAHFARDPALSRSYAAIIVGGDKASTVFDDLALALTAEIGATLQRGGFDEDRASRGARVVYFAYLGLIMTAGKSAVAAPSELDQLLDIIRYVCEPGDLT
jgi:AcrR family transcriptional regulator